MIPELSEFMIDIYQEFYPENPFHEILAEGAQGIGLDIDWGDYPYVTSSHCGVGAVLLNGFPHYAIRDVYGVVKAYDTYVGAKTFQPSGEVFETIQRIGKEFGATTGRKRQVDWLNWTMIEKSIRLNSIDFQIINKLDVLDEVGEWSIHNNKAKVSFKDKDEFSRWIAEKSDSCGVSGCFFSHSPYDKSLIDSGFLMKRSNNT